MAVVLLLSEAKLARNQFLTVAPPLAPTESPPFKNVQNWQLSQNVTQFSPRIYSVSENEILWSLYVTVHYAKCYTLSHICRNVLFPQRCQSAHLKIKAHLYIYMLLTFYIYFLRPLKHTSCTKSVSQSTQVFTTDRQQSWSSTTTTNHTKGRWTTIVFGYVMILNTQSHYVLF